MCSQKCMPVTYQQFFPLPTIVPAVMYAMSHMLACMHALDVTADRSECVCCWLSIWLHQDPVSWGSQRPKPCNPFSCGDTHLWGHPGGLLSELLSVVCRRSILGCARHCSAWLCARAMSSRSRNAALQTIGMRDRATDSVCSLHRQNEVSMSLCFACRLMRL